MNAEWIVRTMPSTVRFLTVVGAIFGIVYGALYVFAVYFEPAQKEVVKPVYGVSIRSE